MGRSLLALPQTFIAGPCHRRNRVSLAESKASIPGSSRLSGTGCSACNWIGTTPAQIGSALVFFIVERRSGAYLRGNFFKRQRQHAGAFQFLLAGLARFFPAAGDDVIGKVP